jgi:hypothetical protein
MFRCLEGIIQQDIVGTDPGLITIAIHVSSFTEPEVDTARANAQILQNQGVRLVLIAHGNNADVNFLSLVTGDASVVFRWLTTSHAPRDARKWLTDIMNCPTSAASMFSENESDW